MGIISEYIEKKLEAETRSKGLLIWLDTKGDYITLVDSLIERYKVGDWPVPIFAFRGSFIELMAESAHLLSGRNMPKGIIHVPGVNEDDIVHTPLYESYCAGKRWRISVATVARECGIGRFTADQIDYMVSQDTLSIETL
jgi:hypothetical protein